MMSNAKVKIKQAKGVGNSWSCHFRWGSWVYFLRLPKEVPQTRWLETTEINCLIVQGLEFWDQGFSRVMFLLKSVRKFFLPSSWLLLARLQSLVFLDIYTIILRSLPLSSHASLFTWLSSFKNTGHTGSGATLLQYDLILTNYIYNAPIFKLDHILSCWVLGLFFSRGHHSTPNSSQERSHQEKWHLNNNQKKSEKMSHGYVGEKISRQTQ